MNKNIKKVWNIAAWCLVAMVVILAILLAGVRVFGFRVFAVLSGSMEPEFMTGSLIYVREVDTDELEVKDVITFMLDENTVATHRIVGLVESEEEPGLMLFKTKGDANQDEDGTPVHPKNVIGQPTFTIPYLGYVAAFIQNPPGTYVAISIGAILVLLVFLPDLIDSEEEKKRMTKKQAASNPRRQTNQERSSQSASKIPCSSTANQQQSQDFAPSVQNEQATAQPKKTRQGTEQIDDRLIRALRKMTPEQLSEFTKKLTPDQMQALIRKLEEKKQNHN
ncbi:MAG: signal peptidase I [Ruminococcaceae bacterium]|nr:signal peptidase I [Oscillospiraceae bacterium]